jgi:UDP-glucuronate 4-epimerase
MKILVTGTAGFIGFHLAKKLLERGDEVVGLDNINDYYDVNLKYARLKELGIDSVSKHGMTEESNSQTNLCHSQLDTPCHSQLDTPCHSQLDTPCHSQLDWESNKLIQSSKYKNHKFIKANLEDSETINNLFKAKKFDAVCNLAAQAGVRYSLENPHAYVNSNVVGFLNILEACRNFDVKNLAYASSSSVYGLNKSQPFKTSDHADHPVSLYAATKKSNELMAHSYSHLYGIQTTGLRFFTVYGPWGRPDMAPMLFADAILNDRAIKVFNHGNMSRDFTYIDDIVDGIIKVIDNPAQALSYSEHSTRHSQLDWESTNLPANNSTAPYKIYNIGNNAPVQLLEFIETLENSIDKKAEKNFMDMQDGDVVSTYADTSGLMNDFDYKPDTDLTDGIGEFIKWYREFYD